MFFFSVYFFYALLTRLLKNKIVVVLTTLYYACFPVFLSCNMSILTESLSVSGTIFFVWLVVEYVYRPGFVKATLIGAMAFLLIMLRPAFLLVLPILCVFWVGRAIMRRETRAKEISGLVATTFSLFLLLGYCQLSKQQFGVFGLSTVSHINQLHILIQSGIYSEGSDPEMNRLIQKNLDEFAAANPKAAPGDPWFYSPTVTPQAYNYAAWTKMSDYYPASRFAAYVDETIKRHRYRYATHTLRKILGAAPIKIGYVDPFNNKPPRIQLYEKTLADQFGWFLTYRFVYCLLFMEFLVSLTILLKVRRLSWSFAFVLLCAGGLIFTAVAGAQSDWSRLAIPALPLVFVLIARYLDLLVCLWRKICGECALSYLSEQP